MQFKTLILSFFVLCIAESYAAPIILDNSATKSTFPATMGQHCHELIEGVIEGLADACGGASLADVDDTKQPLKQLAFDPDTNFDASNAVETVSVEGMKAII
jgi:hypothetical protein